MNGRIRDAVRSEPTAGRVGAPSWMFSAVEPRMAAAPAVGAKPLSGAPGGPKSNVLRATQLVSDRGGCQMQVGLAPESTLFVTKLCCLPHQSPRSLHCASAFWEAQKLN